jgi:hypothetical protein
MEKRMSADDLPSGPSDEDLGVRPAPPPYRLQHLRWLVGMETSDRGVPPELRESCRKLSDDPALPVIRHYGSQVLRVTDWNTGQALERLADWLRATDSTLTAWTVQYVTLDEVARRLKAEAAKVQSHADPHARDFLADQARKIGDETFLRSREIAKQFDKALDPLRRRLERWRKKHPHEHGRDWIEIPDCPRNQERHAYRVAAVQHVIDDSPASS